MEPIVIGVDVGGTNTAAGLVTAAGEVLAEEIVGTHQAGPGTAASTLVGLVEGLLARARARGWTVAGVGVGVPAIVDPASGRADDVHHVPELTGLTLAPQLGARFGVPAFVDNDVNALALGAHAFGPARGAHSLVVLAPGTGFGAGIVLDGRLLRGADGFGGEFGHAPVNFDGRPCWCGGRGCLAVYASGRGIAEAARARAATTPGSRLLEAAGGDPAAIAAPLVFRAAAEGDPAATAVVDEACQALGAMIGVIVNGLNPEVLLITGGVAAGLLPIEAKLLACAEDYAFRRALRRTRIVIVPGDKRVAMRGAAALVLYELARQPRAAARS